MLTKWWTLSYQTFQLFSNYWSVVPFIFDEVSISLFVLSPRGRIEGRSVTLSLASSEQPLRLCYWWPVNCHQIALAYQESKNKTSQKPSKPKKHIAQKGRYTVTRMYCTHLNGLRELSLYYFGNLTYDFYNTSHTELYVSSEVLQMKHV